MEIGRCISQGKVLGKKTDAQKNEHLTLVCV